MDRLIQRATNGFVKDEGETSLDHIARRKTEMPTLYRKLQIGVLWLVVVVITSMSAVTNGAWADAGGTEVVTKFSCNNPEIPALVLTLAFPREAAIVEHALRSEVCRYTDNALPVTPVHFLRQVKAGPDSAEPYGYIWAIRVAGGQVAYWFFWRDEHEAMLEVSPGI